MWSYGWTGRDNNWESTPLRADDQLMQSFLSPLHVPRQWQLLVDLPNLVIAQAGKPWGEREGLFFIAWKTK